MLFLVWKLKFNIDMRVVIKSILIIIYTLFHFDVISQDYWTKLNNEKSFYCEDIAVSQDGKIYISIEGRNSILESNNDGINWIDICLNDKLGIRYFAINNSKKLFVGHQNNLVELLYDNGFIVPRYYNGATFVIDSLITKFNAQISDQLLFDKNGNYYYIEKSQLNKYINPYFNSYKIFDVGEKILSAFMYDTINNYIVTSQINGIIKIYKLNTTTFESKLLISNFHEGANISGVFVTENGTILVSSVVGLYRYTNDGATCDIVQIEPNIDPISNIQRLTQTLKGGFIVQIDNSFYFSNDQGKTWVKLLNYGTNFPLGNIVKIISTDSSSSVILIEQDCGIKIPYLLNTKRQGWSKINSEISALKFSSLSKTSNGTIYAQNDKSCSLFATDDESESWTEPKILGQKLYTIFELGDTILFATTINDYKLYKSIDFGLNWKHIDALEFGDPNIKFLGLKQIVPSHVYLITGLMDSLTSNFLKYIVYKSYDGYNWEIQSEVSSNFILRELVYDPYHKVLISYQPWSNSQVYFSSDEGNNFQLDDKFSQFNRIYSLNYNDKGEYIVCGELNGKLNLYLYKDLINFVPYQNDLFKNKFITPIKKLANNNLLGISGTDGLFLTSDGGENWINISKGLNLNGPEIYLLKDVLIDRNNIGYVCLEYDGLYKSNGSIVNTMQYFEENKISVSPNPVDDLLCFHTNEGNSFINSTILIYDNLGRIVLSKKIKDDYDGLTIQVNQISSGTYYYKILNSKDIFSSGKFIKI